MFGQSLSNYDFYYFCYFCYFLHLSNT